MKYTKLYTGENFSQQYIDYYNKIKNTDFVGNTEKDIYYRNVKRLLDLQSHDYHFHIDFESKRTDINYIDEVVSICSQLGRTELSKETLDFFDIELDSGTNAILYYIRALYLPYSFVTELPTYFNTWWFLLFKPRKKKYRFKIKPKDEMLNDLYSILGKCYPNYKWSREAEHLFPLIIGHLNMCNKYNRDDVIDYFNNLPYYLEKIRLNDIDFRIIDHTDSKILYLLSNFDSFFDKERVGIK